VSTSYFGWLFYISRRSKYPENIAVHQQRVISYTLYASGNISKFYRVRENATIDKQDGITREPRGISGTVHFPVHGKAAFHTRCRVHFLLFRSRNLFLERPAVMSLVMRLFCMQREAATTVLRAKCFPEFPEIASATRSLIPSHYARKLTILYTQ